MKDNDTIKSTLAGNTQLLHGISHQLQNNGNIIQYPNNKRSVSPTISNNSTRTVITGPNPSTPVRSMSKKNEVITTYQNLSIREYQSPTPTEDLDPSVVDEQENYQNLNEYNDSIDQGQHYYDTEDESYNDQPYG